MDDLLDSVALSMVFLYNHDSASLGLYPSAFVLHIRMHSNVDIDIDIRTVCSDPEDPDSLSIHSLSSWSFDDTSLACFLIHLFLVWSKIYLLVSLLEIRYYTSLSKVHSCTHATSNLLSMSTYAYKLALKLAYT